MILTALTQGQRKEAIMRSTLPSAIIPIVAAVQSPREFVPAPLRGRCVSSEQGLNGNVEGTELQTGQEIEMPGKSSK
jgi:hypothetical protein